VWVDTVGGESVSAPTVNEYGAELERNWSSVTVQLPMRPPGTASLRTVRALEKTKPVASAVRSECPPVLLQLVSQLTASPVLSGFVPGVTVAVTVTSLPGAAVCGVTVTINVGDVVSSAAAVLPTTPAARSAHATSAPDRRRKVLN
jgi:hypothetical protein